MVVKSHCLEIYAKNENSYTAQPYHVVALTAVLERASHLTRNVDSLANHDDLKSTSGCLLSSQTTTALSSTEAM